MKTNRRSEKTGSADKGYVNRNRHGRGSSVPGIVAAGILAAVLMTACGSSASLKSLSIPEERAAGSIMKEAAYDSMAATEAAAYYDYGSEGDEVMNLQTGNGAREVPDAAELDAAAAAQSQRKLIRTVTISGETEKYDEAVSSIRSSVVRCGGYIEQMDEHNSGGTRALDRSVYLTARIPEPELDGFLNGAFNQLAITYRSERTEDITLRYTDLDARKKVLRTELDRLTELLAEADSIESVIALEDRLSEVRYEIDSIESSLRTYDNKVSYSTVEISVTEVRVAQPVSKAGVGERISRGLRQKFADIRETGEDLLIWFVVSLPVLVILAAVILLVRWIVRGIIKAKRRRTDTKGRKDKRIKAAKADKKEKTADEAAAEIAETAENAGNANNAER